MKLKILLFLGSLLLVFVFADTTLACSCATKPTVLDAFESSELVIIAKAVSVEMIEEAKGVDLEAQIKKAGYDTSYNYVKSTKMKVEKVYKGNVKVGDELLFGQGGGADCIWTFGIKSVGGSFLFYLDKPTTHHPFFSEEKISDQPAYFPVTCGRSENILGYETDDLKYLNNLNNVKGKTRISGTIGCWGECADVAGIKIKIIGDKKTFQTQTDENGVYEIYDLPPGKYLLEPEIPKGWKIDQFMLEYSPAFREAEYLSSSEEKTDLSKRVPVVLTAGNHTGIDFFLDEDTAIRGKVLSPDGKPLKGVCVTAVSTELKEGDYRGRFNCTNEEGIFLIEEMYSGKYILVANKDAKISVREPFGTYFYPNVKNYKDAKPVEIKLGDHLDDLIIQIPAIEYLVTISGKWTYGNGKPVVNEWVEYDIDEKSEKIYGKQSVKTDKNGNFSFKVLKGLKGNIYGKLSTYIGEFANCPQIDDAVKKISGGGEFGEIKTEAVSIDADKDLTNIELKLPFPGCVKKKK